MIVFIDEVGFSFLARLGSTWAPRGRTPTLRRVGSQRRELSTIVGLSLSGRIHKQHFTKAISAEDVVMFLMHLLQQHRQRLLVVMDRAGIHTAGLVTNFLAAQAAVIGVEWLPRCAPELNPEEDCHGNVKTALRNLTPHKVSELRQYVDRGFARLRRRPDLLLGFFHHAGLTVKELW
jgi:transposase